MPDASWRAEEPSQCGWYQYVPAKADHGAWDTPRSYTARGIAAAAALTVGGFSGGAPRVCVNGILYSYVADSPGPTLHARGQASRVLV